MTDLIDTLESGNVCLHAGWLIDGSGCPVKTDQIVTIQAGRIVAVTDSREAHPGESTPIDLRHCTLLPALMDAHVHLTLSGTLDPASRQSQLQQSANEDLRAVERHLKDQWRHGVAVVRHAGDRRGVLLDFPPYPPSPVAVKVTLWAWHGPGRYGRIIGRTPPDTMQLNSSVGAAANNGLDHIKVINSGINSLDRFGHQTPPQFTREELYPVCRYAKEKALPVMVHANGAAAVKASIEAGCSSIEHGFFMGADNLSRMADNGVVWVPTAIPMAALTRPDVVTALQADVARRTLDHQLEQIALGRAKGATIALGTDAGSMGVDHGDAVRRELGLFMQAGLSLTEAVCCGTLNAARLMGLEKRGGILPGFDADIIAVEGTTDDLPGSLKHIHSRFTIHTPAEWHI